MNHINSFQKDNLSPPGENISLCVTSVCPLEGTIASQINQPGIHEAPSASPSRVGSLASYEAVWQTVSTAEWVTCKIMQGYRLQFVEEKKTHVPTAFSPYILRGAPRKF